MKSASFTGHRKIKGDTAELSKKLYNLLEKDIVSYDLTDFYAGGALGFDTLGAQTVLKLKKQFPHIRLHLVLPCPTEEQTETYNEKDKKEFTEILDSADSSETVCPHKTNDCMKLRNARLIEFADLCYCYFNENQFRSGTGQTVRMAEKKGIVIFNLYNK